MRKISWRQTTSIFVFLLGGMLGGCAHDHLKPVTMDAVEKVNLAVELRLTNALQQATYSTDPDEAFGQPLCNDSEIMARTVFREVQVSKGGSASGPASLANVDAVLVPVLGPVQQDRPMTVNAEQTTTTQMTWTLRDRDGKVLWVATVTGEYKGMMGVSILYDAGLDNLQLALQDLFRKSAAKMASDSVIRQYAARVSKPTTP